MASLREILSKMTFCQKIGGIDEVLEKFYPALMLVYIIYIISNSTPQKSRMAGTSANLAVWILILSSSKPEQMMTFVEVSS